MVLSSNLCAGFNFSYSGNEAANTITQAVLKTAGNSDSGAANYIGLDEEKLKSIEPKMVELIMNEVV